MSIKLVFNGGFFVPLPGAGVKRKVLVYVRKAKKVLVTDQNGKHDAYWEKELLRQSSIDLISRGPLEPAHKLPMRHLSDLLPIDYNGFHKVVGFTGGKVSGHYKNDFPQQDLELHASAKVSNDINVMLAAFKKVCEIKRDDHDEDYKKGIVQRFCDEDPKLWKKGYCVEVELDPKNLHLLLGGRRPTKELKDGLQIELLVDDESKIPHFPLDNPHVLEQPPTD